MEIGGIAGGDKYIAQGILFKFAKDRNVYGNTWLYGGKKPNEYLAAKSAGQELLSANYVGSHSPLIKVPLMAIVDYWGHRLIAMALLPITKNSLVYGSADAGTTVLSQDPIVTQEMNTLGKTLNLQQHNVGSTLMALCGDLEVHECSFNVEKNHNTQYYCLDAARVFPPEFHKNTKKTQSIFYEKLRPEFVKQYKIPLSSDSFTRFQDKDQTGEKYNKAALEAAEYLHKNIIPLYIKELTKQKTIEEILSTTSLYYTLRWSNRDYVPNALIYHMHQHGINLRHLGKIITLLEALNPQNLNCSPKMLGRLKKYVYNVMITRVIKNHVRQQVSETAKEEKEYKETLLNVMNLVTCAYPESEAFWQQTVPGLLKSKFEISADNISKNLQQGFLLLNFCQLSGIVLHPVCFDKFSKKYNSKMKFKFGASDVIDIRPTIKYSNYIDLATGIYYFLFNEKNKKKSRISTDYLQKAYDRLLSPLSTWSNFAHPILPENFSDTVSQMKERIIETKIQTKQQVEEKCPQKNSLTPRRTTSPLSTTIEIKPIKKEKAKKDKKDKTMGQLDIMQETFKNVTTTNETKKETHSTESDRYLTMNDIEILKFLEEDHFGKTHLSRIKMTGMEYLMKTQRIQALTKLNTQIHDIPKTNHPFLTNVRWLGQTEEQLYFLCDHPKSEKLFSYLQKGKKFTDTQAKFYAAQIVLGLEQLHHLGIVYEQFTPECLRLTASGNVVLTNFVLKQEDQLYKATEYMAPEYLQGITAATRATNWWSFGNIVYAMLCGLPPFYNKNKNEICNNIIMIEDKKRNIQGYYKWGIK